LTVSDVEILLAQHELAVSEGVFAAPEGAAAWAGLKHLYQQGWVHPVENIILYNTGSGLKYI
jgi:threonine synthase